MQAALVALLLAQRHVVAQIVETEFVVGTVGDVGRIGLVLVGVIHARIHHAHVQAEEVVQLAHLGGVTPGQIVVDGDHMHTLAGERIEVDR